MQALRAGVQRSDGAGPARRRSGRRWRTLLSNETGAAAVEFALVSPFFFFLTFVIAQTAIIFVAEQVLDNAVFASARLIRTGQAQNGNFSKADFQNQVCERAKVFIDCTDGDFYLDVRSADSFADFANLSLTPPVDEEDDFNDNSEFEAGGPGSIVVVRAYYQWPTSPIFGDLSLQNLANGKRLIGSFAAFRNEPFVPTEE